MKKFIKILLIIIFIVFLILLIAPVLFKGKIMERARIEINKSVTAQVNFDDLKLSVIRSFPNLFVGLENLSVIGIDEFEGDTLLAFNELQVKVDLISAIKMDSIKVKTISLLRPTINGIILEDGKANWDIAPAAEEIEEELDTTEAEPLDMTLSLKKLEILDARIAYIDHSSGMEARLDDLDFTLTGDFSEKLTNLVMNLDIAAIDFIMEGIKYADHTRLNFLVDVEADLENSVFTIKENSLSLNELTLGLEGMISMPDTQNIDVDVKYFTKETDFKSLLSMVPAIYSKEFEGLRAGGTLALNGWAKGRYNENIMPSAALNLVVKNAMFAYPDLPEQVDNINIDIDLLFNGVENDSTTIDINKFHLDIAGNPIDMTINIKTPMSDMHVNGNLTTRMDLSTLSSAIPLEDMSVTGLINTNLDWMGYLSTIEKEQYEDFKADGSVMISNLKYESADMPYNVVIKNAKLDFSPRFVELGSFDAQIGESDIQLYGRLENFIPYVFKDETVRGELRLTSNTINLNEFMTEEPEEEEVATEDSIPLTVFEVPKNINFALNSNLGEVIYDKLEIKDLTGTIYVKEGAVWLEKLSMNMLDGFMVANGQYNTKDITKPFVDFNLDITGFDIPMALNAFNTIQKLAPVAKNATGKISSSLSFVTYLDESMTPIMNTVVSRGNLTSKSIGLQGASMFSKIGEKLKSDRFSNLTLKDVDLNYEVRDGRVFVDPFEAKIGKGSAIIGGDQGIDQTMNYTINLSMPRSELGSGASSMVENMTSNALEKGIKIDPGENLNFDIKVGGTFKDPDVSISMKDNVRQSVQVVKQQVKEQAQAAVDKKKEEARQKAREEADRLIQNAEKEAEQIREAGRKAAEATRKEGYAKADQLVKEAKNPLAKRLAEESSKKLKAETDKKADKIIEEADKKADAVVQKAREQADRLLQ